MAKINNFSICLAGIWHKRLRPSVNEFFYRVFYLCFDVTKTPEIISKLLSWNRFNLFSFYDKDHAKLDGANLENWIRDILSNHDLSGKTKRIFLLTHPRVLGYVFNPVSFWFCLNDKEELIAVVAEVNNTFGENHNYLIFNPDHAPIGPNQWFDAKKEFHVSPFFTREGKYRFKFDYTHEKFVVFIDYFNEEKLLLNTSLVALRKPLNDINLIKAFFTIPFVTFKVIILIHYQALKIVFKGIKYIKKPAQLSNKITKIFK